MGAAAGSGELGRVRCDFAFKHVNPTLIIREHAVPLAIIRAVGEDVLSTVTLPSIPAFDQQALVEIERDLASGATRHAGIGHIPIAEPEVQLPAFRVCGTSFG